MLTLEQKEQFNEILEALGQTLDITESQYEDAVRSYEYVGRWLAATDSPLAIYSPEILPQGSFLLQTMIRPINVEEDIDVDLVCKLENIQPDTMTQFRLKHMVGERLKANAKLNKLLSLPDGRRCWTLKYADSSRFHMDILPSVVATGYKKILDKAFDLTDISDAQHLGVRITDKESPLYKLSTNLQEWQKSNPFGYALWFQERCSIGADTIKLMRSSVQAFPQYQKKKLPLQRVVQILKRHRDIMWQNREDKEDKPISIIITTLASKAYKKERNIIEALETVVSEMPNYIEHRLDEHNNRIKWVPNPVNYQENFADKWPTYPKREENFYLWLEEIKKDLNAIKDQMGKGIHSIGDSLEKPFGKDVVSKSLSTVGETLRKKRENGLLNVASQTGMVGTTGTTRITRHNFYGKKEQ